ncbi:MAG: sensor histidine kinase [Chitinophagaceae bacterium]
MKFTIAYGLVFMYVIAAIVFWGYSLQKASQKVYMLEKENVSLKNELHRTDAYNADLQKVEEGRIRRTRQYWGEGTTFLVLTLIASGIVYYAYYRQRQLSKLQQNFMLSVTHELKTPIAGIKLNMQTIEKRKLDEALQKKLVQSAIQETNRLNDLCNNILWATQIENKKLALYSEQVSLPELIEEEMEEFMVRHPQMQIQTNISKDIEPISGDRTWWKLILSNLIENARKYTEAGTPIAIHLFKQRDNILLQIADQGIGIPDEEKNKIFDKFYRSGDENTRKSSGTGLGLFLVKKILTLYKYDISVKNNSPKGSIFEIRIRH